MSRCQRAGGLLAFSKVFCTRDRSAFHSGQSRHVHGRILDDHHHDSGVFPVVVALGYDPMWFGVIITMLIEIAMISPPDGTIMYVLQGMRLTPGPISDVFLGVTPIVLIYMAGVGS